MLSGKSYVLPSQDRNWRVTTPPSTTYDTVYTTIPVSIEMQSGWSSLIEKKACRKHLSGVYKVLS